MKKLMLRIFAVSTLCFIIGASVAAQETTNGDRDQTRQKDQTQLKDQNRVRSQNREAFRNSLTEEQLAILENQEMTRSQKRKAFMGSLTDEQKVMLRERSSLRQQQRNELQCNTATQTQTQQMNQYRGGNTDAAPARNRKGRQ